jgi:nucleotide-binding universal stress UspA family protein
MSERPQRFSIRRVLVVLDASPENPAVLETAVGLAAGLRTELQALFVEDTNLLRLTELPFLRAVDPFSGATRELSSQSMEQGIRAYASLAREALARTASRSRVRWSFRTVRGTGASGALTVASDADLVILGSPSRPTDPATREAVSKATGSVLVLRERVRPGGGPVLVLYDGTPGSLRAVEIASSLASTWRAPLVLLTPAGSPEAPPELVERLTAGVHRLSRVDVPAVLNAMRAEGGVLLVLPLSTPLAPALSLWELLEESRSPVLLVAGRGA